MRPRIARLPLPLRRLLVAFWELWPTKISPVCLRCGAKHEPGDLDDYRARCVKAGHWPASRIVCPRCWLAAIERMVSDCSADT